jgi:lysophospholipase L1-like esterase
MPHPHQDPLSLTVSIVGGACLAVFSAMLLVVLLSPAVPPATRKASDADRSLKTAVQRQSPAMSDDHHHADSFEPAPVAMQQTTIQKQTLNQATSQTPSQDSSPAATPAVVAPVAAPHPSEEGASTTPASTEPPSITTNVGRFVATTTSPKQFVQPTPGAQSGTTDPRGLVILQLGDSHTAADYFTGEVRAQLQQRYGNGGVGYIDAGKPHIGVRSNTVKITASSGWSYHAIQRSDDIGQFWLSGFNAVTSASGETLSFAADNPVPFDSIEIEALRQPGGGSIDISLDGTVKASADLGGKTVEPLVLRLRPDAATRDRVRQIEIHTRSDGPVSIASVGLYLRQAGVSYNNIGYPGATVDLLNKFDPTLMADDLRRLDPQIVVLAFGTNEASKPNLTAASYERTYEKAIARITATLPNAQIVLVGPPDGAERPPHCAGKHTSEACHPAAPVSSAGAVPEPTDCDWHTIAHLDLVRDVERRIAERHGFTYWNWASIQPGDCASAQWVAASPPLMTPDHVHFTPLGYHKGADRFVDILIPVIEKLKDKLSVAERG